MGKGARTEQVVREIHRHRRRRFSAEEKVRIVLEGLRGQDSVAELCRREGLAPSLYYARARVSGGGQEAAAGDTTRRRWPPGCRGCGTKIRG